MSRPLAFDELDPWFPETVAREPGCGHLHRCVGCGVCTALCPVSAMSPDFSPGLILRQVLLGLKGEVLGSPLLWQCAACARCSFVCPQDVRFLDIIQALRRLAVQEGYVSREKAQALAAAEGLLAELRQRTLAALAGGEGLSPRQALARALAEMNPSHEE